jgi:LemA protein
MKNENRAVSFLSSIRIFSYLENKTNIITMNIKVIIGIIVVALLVVWGISSYNGLVEKQENVNQAWAQVENKYQRRADLIPNLVSVVKGAADFEQETLTEVTQARQQVNNIKINPSDLDNPQKLQQFQQAQSQLSGALTRLLAVAEDYPELRATARFGELQQQLEGTENRISTERGRFNEAAQSYNTTTRRFPTNIFAGLFGFDEKAYFEAEEGAQEVPEVEF